MPSEVGEAGAKSGHSPRDVLLVIVGLVIRTIGQKELGNRPHNSQHLAPAPTYSRQVLWAYNSLSWILVMHCTLYCLIHGCKRQVKKKKKELEKEDLAAKGSPSPGFKHGSLGLTLFCSQGHL